MSGKYLEFKMNPIYSVTYFVLAAGVFLWAASHFYIMFESKTFIHGLTGLAALFLTACNLIAGDRNRNKTVLLITPQSLQILTETIPAEAIRRVEINNYKITFWISSGESEYTKNLSLNMFKKEDHERVTSALKELI